MSIFDLDTAIPSNTGGAADVSYVRVVPEGGSVNQQSGSYVGSGLGTTTFNIPANKWYSPAMSNFVLTIEVGKMDAAGTVFGPVASADYVALCDNFVDTFFTQIQTNLNSSTLESIMFPHIVSTTCQYTNATKNYNSTFGSQAGVGIPFMTRYKELLAGAANSRTTMIEVEFRPPAGFWNLHKLPPGIQSQTIFNWSTDPQCFECPITNVQMGTSAYQYNVAVKQFVLNLATLTPSAGVPLPQEGLITLTSATCIRSNLSGGQELNVPISAPAACNRAMIVFQDTNTTALTDNAWLHTSANTNTTIKAGVGSGPFPVTSFTTAASTSAASAAAAIRAAKLQRLQMQAGTRAIQPSPVYNFQNEERDRKRAYADYNTVSQGSGKADSGTLSYGNDDMSVGIPLLFFTTTAGAPTSLVINEGDENAIEVPKIRRTEATTTYWTANIAPHGLDSRVIPTASAFKYSSLTGWIGKYPIFPFDIVRLPGEDCGMIQLNAAFDASVASVAAYTVMLYDMAIKCTRRADGQYDAEFFALK